MPDPLPNLRCARCGDVIGTYEPLVVVGGEQTRETSQAAEPELRRSTGAHYHRACHAELASRAG